MTQKLKRQLAPRAWELLQASNAERIAFIQTDRWIGYPQAKDALEQMERLLNYPNVSRPQNMLLVTETNNGKTTIAKRFRKLHPEVDDPALEYTEIPVVVMDAPPSPDEDRFYNHMLDQLGAVYKIRAPKDAKLFQVRKLLRDMHVRVLIFDEINNSLAGTSTMRQQMFNAIKNLGQAIERPIVLTGTFDALVAVREDPQIQNRFKPLVLPRWELNSDFLQLLASFETTLPLRRASHLSSERLAPLLLVMSAYVIGELNNLLKAAAEKAITSGTERITLKLLYDLDWVPPDLRDRHASAAAQGVKHKVSYRDLLSDLERRQAEQEEQEEQDEDLEAAEVDLEESDLSGKDDLDP